MQALITGGAGFIGSHLAEFLLSEGHQVRILDNLSSGRLENLAGFRERVEFVQGDVRDAGLLAGLCQGCELVFHQAAVVSVPYSVDHPEETNDVNIGGTLNVLQGARRAGVRRVVFASSAAIYGEDPALPKTEQMLPQPVSPYGVQKITGEYLLATYARLHGLETAALRYFNVFGPRQDPSSPYSGVISIFVDRLRAGKTPTIFGDGEQSRDFVYVANVVRANWLAATVPGAAGRVYNIGCGRQTTLNQLLARLAELIGAPGEAEHREPRAGDIRHSLADIGRAEAELGYRPEIGVEEGLRRLVQSVG